MTSAAVLALFDEDQAPAVLARCPFYVASPSRDGASAGREQAGGVILHRPVAAIILPSDFPLLSWRRPDFPGLRHVLVRFRFMLERLPPRHLYESATVTITLDHPEADVLAQNPSLLTAEAESSDSTTTELSAALNGLAQLGAHLTKVTATKRKVGMPLITAENCGPAGFGWHYEAQEGAPLLPRIESASAVIELPRAMTELSGTIRSEAVVSVPRYGVFTKSKAIPSVAPVPFRLPLGIAG